jgi:hypothetical protein
MPIRATSILAISASFALTGAAAAQDLGPQIKKLADNVYVYVGKDFNSNAGIIVTTDGVVLVDNLSRRGAEANHQEIATSRLP